MAVGVSRNTAEEAAAAAARAGMPLDKCLGRLLTLRGIFAWRNKTDLVADFEHAVLNAARMTPRRIRPLRRKRRGHDGLRVQFSMIDEMHTVPASDFAMVGIDLANGPDFTAGGGGNDWPGAAGRPAPAAEAARHRTLCPGRRRHGGGPGGYGGGKG